MRRVLPIAVSTLLAAALLGLGYAQWSPDHEGKAALAGAASQGAAPATRSTRAVHQFASLEDKGDLLGYSGTPASRSASAPNWYRADISEQHAFRSIVTDNMAVTAPDGSKVRLRYQRHIEHPNGNWTWIGRNADGQEAIVTFGEKAVFGSIPNGDTELRLTTMAGRSWVIQVDPRKEREPEPKQPDYLVPPELTAALASPGSVAADQPQIATADQPQAASAAATITTVDVAVGYTTGYASELGGDSQAVTRLQHLVDVTNQAYANSQIGAQIRLVKTVPVAFADATDNDDALRKMTGTEAAFNQLRAARDQYGADLVSLVRRFRTPENGGCGLAWLIGGNQSTIDNSDAPYGYSVVSDDIDKGELNESDQLTYGCRKESLAHELGHNMGQNHNVEDAGGDSGVHAYSYGYREAASNGFYTVMAYKLTGSSQRGVRYFANPNVLEGQSGRPTGIANASDNARSMAATMPLVANFRAQVVTSQSENTVCSWTKSDFNGDGRSDLFWRHSADGWNAIWHSANSSTSQDVAPEPSQLWQIVGYGDFNGDGKSDVLWRHATQGWNVIWRSANPATSTTIAQVASQDWKAAAIGDFDGDGRSDILWRHATGGWNVYWPSGDSAAAKELAPELDQMWRIAGVGDFNGDGRSDILWRHMLQGWNVIWRSGDSSARTEVTAVTSQDWQVGGIGDFDADGRADILWRANQGWNVYWPSGSSANARELSAVSDPAWKIVGIADFDGDGRSDLFWRHASAGWNTVWRSANSATQLTVSTVQDLRWQVPGMCRIDTFTR